LRYSVWIDDLTISDNFVRGIVLNEIRDIIHPAGLKLYRMKYRNGNQSVFVTEFSIIEKSILLTQVDHRKSVHE
jgi:hypothetical protein